MTSVGLTAGCSLDVESAVPSEEEMAETIDLQAEDEAETSITSTSTTSASTTPSTATSSTETSTSSSTTASTTLSTTTSSTATSTTSAKSDDSATPKETTAAAGSESGDAEPGLQFDFGSVERWSGLGTDRVTIEFDRYQMDDGRYGPALTTEVQLAGATDLVWRNENPKLRTYVVSPSVEALALDPAWLVEACGSAEEPEARYQTMDLEEFLSKYTFVGLAFDGDGQIIRFREQTSC